jgi:cytochrome c556
MTTDHRFPAGAASTRANNVMYAHPSSKQLRADERGVDKPQNPVTAEKVRQRAETAHDVAEQKRESAALENEWGRARLKDPIGRRDGEFNQRRKEMKERYRDHNSARTARHQRRLDEIARQNPVA